MDRNRVKREWVDGRFTQIGKERRRRRREKRVQTRERENVVRHPFPLLPRCRLCVISISLLQRPQWLSNSQGSFRARKDRYAVCRRTLRAEGKGRVEQRHNSGHTLHVDSGQNLVQIGQITLTSNWHLTGILPVPDLLPPFAMGSTQMSFTVAFVVLCAVAVAAAEGTAKKNGEREEGRAVLMASLCFSRSSAFYPLALWM